VGNDWRLSVHVTPAPSAAPGDVTLVPADQLATLPVLRPTPLPPTPEGASLPFADGHDWKLVYEDDFHRQNLGTEWIPSDGSTWQLHDGHLTAGGNYFEYLTYDASLTRPLRVEADIAASPDRAVHWMWAFTLTPRKEATDRAFWGANAHGYGYMLCVGWHDRRTNEVWRNSQEVQVTDKGPFLDPGKPHHILAQFAAPRLLLVVDGTVSLDYTDTNWLPDVDTFSLMSGWALDQVNNVRIYTAAPAGGG
jgi:hypothetical protein